VRATSSLKALGRTIPETYFGMGDGLELWDLTTGQPLKPIPMENNEIVTGFEFSPNGKKLATACFNHKIELKQDEARSYNKIWRLPK
jgi:WD40 repeat protein